MTVLSICCISGPWQARAQGTRGLHNLRCQLRVDGTEGVGHEA